MFKSKKFSEGGAIFRALGELTIGFICGGKMYPEVKEYAGSLGRTNEKPTTLLSK